jgi:hypothetical protein
MELQRHKGRKEIISKMLGALGGEKSNPIVNLLRTAYNDVKIR